MVSEHASPLAVLGGVDAGGQNVHVAALASELGRRGIDVTVYTRREDPGAPRLVPLSARVSVEHVDAGPPEEISKDEILPYMDDFSAWLTAAWGRERPDVVHAHFWMSGRAALAAGRSLDLPVVQTFHALGVVKRRHQGFKDTSVPERLAEEEALVRGVDRIIATCSDEVFELIGLGADPECVHVVPCGVDLDLFTPEGPAERRSPHLRRVVVVSRLVERKGIGNVICALPEVPDAELVVAGGPDVSQLPADPTAARLIELARSVGLEDRVHLRGRVDRDRLPALIRSADAVVSVPWYEPFGIVPLEAMACGVPVVASAVGGLIDTVRDGVTGIHVPPRRPDVLAHALRELLDDQGARRRLGAAGARRARNRYSWERVAGATVECYSELLEDRLRSAEASASMASGSVGGES